MSDDGPKDGWIGSANAGITLPGNNSATHNPYLSPLFFLRAGRATPGGTDNATIERDKVGYYWSPNTQNQRFAFFSIFAIDHLYSSTPEYRPRAQSLRCLVSTNNG